jgi:putative ABC transport system permease protein
MIIGCGLLTPGIIVLLVSLTRPFVSRTGALLRMAIRDLERHLSRTGVAVAALMIAVSATIGVGVMVDSFRGGVTLWIQDLINADIYIAPPGFENGGDSPALRPQVLRTIRETPGVAAMSTYRGNQVNIDATPVQLLALELAPAAKAGYRLVAGQPETVWRAFNFAGAVVVSEPLAYRRQIRTGEHITLSTPSGPRTFPVAGIFLDYGSEHGRILMQRSTYQRFWNDSEVDSAAVYVAPDVSVKTLRERLENRVGHLQKLILRSNRDIQAFTLAVFERTFTITNVLRLLAVIVAFVGILSALLAMQLERAREFAILRATGMTVGEVGWLVSLQTGVMGLLAGLLAIPVGLGLAAVLIFVINRRAFGWTLPFEVEPWILVQAVVLAIIAALLAGLYPIRRMALTHPADALREE